MDLGQVVLFALLALCCDVIVASRVGSGCVCYDKNPILVALLSGPPGCCLGECGGGKIDVCCCDASDQVSKRVARPTFFELPTYSWDSGDFWPSYYGNYKRRGRPAFLDRLDQLRSHSGFHDSGYDVRSYQPRYFYPEEYRRKRRSVAAGKPPSAAHPDDPRVDKRKPSFYDLEDWKRKRLAGGRYYDFDLAKRFAKPYFFDMGYDKRAPSFYDIDYEKRMAKGRSFNFDYEKRMPKGGSFNFDYEKRMPKGGSFDFDYEKRMPKGGSFDFDYEKRMPKGGSFDFAYEKRMPKGGSFDFDYEKRMPKGGSFDFDYEKRMAKGGSFDFDYAKRMPKGGSFDFDYAKRMAKGGSFDFDYAKRMPKGGSFDFDYEKRMANGGYYDLDYVKRLGKELSYNVIPKGTVNKSATGSENAKRMPFGGGFYDLDYEKRSVDKNKRMAASESASRPVKNTDKDDRSTT